MMGRIQRQPAQVQVDFIRLCCKYWQKECILSVEDAELEAMDSYAVLLKYKLINEIDCHVVIEFLDEQMVGINARREQASAAGKRSAELRNRSTVVQRSLESVEQNSTEKSRVDKSRVDSDKKRKGVIPPPPIFSDVLAYFKENGYSEQAAKKAFDYYQTSLTDTKPHWSDGKGNPIKNWKMKMQSVWFKEEHKEVKKTEQPRFTYTNPIL